VQYRRLSLAWARGRGLAATAKTVTQSLAVTQPTDHSDWMVESARKQNCSISKLGSHDRDRWMMMNARCKQTTCIVYILQPCGDDDDDEKSLPKKQGLF